MTFTWSGRVSSRSRMERMILRPSPPGRSVRPMEPAKRVSPANQELLGREVEADAALGVAGGVEDFAGEIGQADLRAVVGAGVGRGDFGGLNAEPSGLHLHHGELGQVVLIQKNGCAGDALERDGSAHVVDVGVGDDDLLEGELVGGEAGEDFGDVFAGVDDDRFARGFVAEDGAVAAQHPDREGFKNHGAGSRASRLKSRLLGRLAGSCGRGRCGRRLGAREHRARAALAGDEDEESDRGAHEDDRRPGGELGEQVGGAARAKGGLRTLAAEGSGEVGALALLQKDHANQEEANDDVDDGEKDDHSSLFLNKT